MYAIASNIQTRFMTFDMFKAYQHAYKESESRNFLPQFFSLETLGPLINTFPQ
jgi:hypothetical protein